MEHLNLEKVLIDVRTAYRLLHDYQRRLLDIVISIRDGYNRNYFQSQPKFSDRTPSKNDKHLDRWSWDWLNLYYTEFKFDSYSDGQNEHHFGIFLISDDGYYRNELIEKKESRWEEQKNKIFYGSDRVETQKFAHPAESDSKLILVAGVNIYKPEGVYGNSFNLPQFILSSEQSYKNEEGVMISKTLSLNNLVDKDALDKILNEFDNSCQQNNIIVKIPRNI